MTSLTETIPLFDKELFAELSAGGGVHVFIIDDRTVGFISADNKNQPHNYFEAVAVDPSFIDYEWKKFDEKTEHLILEKKNSIHFVIPRISLTTFKALCESSFKKTKQDGGFASDFTNRLKVRLEKLLSGDAN